MSPTKGTRKDRAKFLLLPKRKRGILPVGTLKVGPFMKGKPDILQKTLQAETRDWEQAAAISARFFEMKAEDLT